MPPYIAVRIDPAAKPDRIALNVSPYRRIVVAEVVVVEICFLVEVLAGQYYITPLPYRAVSNSSEAPRLEFVLSCPRQLLLS